MLSGHFSQDVLALKIKPLFLRLDCLWLFWLWLDLYTFLLNVYHRLGDSARNVIQRVVQRQRLKHLLA
jgi:hypothetical protein